MCKFEHIKAVGSSRDRVAALLDDCFDKIKSGGGVGVIYWVIA